MSALTQFARRSLAAVLGLCLLTGASLAHDGPPYPIIVDEVAEGWTVSIWADPDVGTGTFYYYVEAPPGGALDDVRIEARAVPQDGMAPEVFGVSEPAEKGEPFQQIGTLEFHHRGLWDTRFLLRVGGEGSAPLHEFTYALDVTPPGLGAFDILWFAFPFLVVAGIWLRALLKQRSYDRQALPAIEP